MMAGGRPRPAGQGGYAMAVLLVTLAVMGVALSVAMPVWRTVAQREREEELIFRGGQYTRAISLFQRRFANAYPPSFDVLVEQKFLRKKFKDPMTKDGEFEVLYQGSALAVSGVRGSRSGASGRQGGSSTSIITPGRGAVGPQGGVIGVASKSTDKSLRILDGRSQYNEWQFIWLAASRPGRGGGASQRGGRGGRGEEGPGFGTPGPGAGRGRGQGGGRGGVRQPGGGRQGPGR